MPRESVRGPLDGYLPDRSWRFRAGWALGRSICRLCFRARVVHPERIPASGPAVLVSNHPTWLDPPLLFLILERRFHFMGWDRLFTLPIAGRLLRAGGAFPVKIGGTDRSAIQRALEHLRGGRGVGIFPEGGRSLPGGALAPFRPGAAMLAVWAGAPIVPVTLNGAYRLWPRGRALPRLGGPIRAIVHPPIVPPRTGLEAARGDLPERLTEEIRRVIVADYADQPRDSA
ncbi:MAG: 1-acyl-sn-glycerol-3-phosphate acyltransferase [Planctomycetales bacterium]|nr:1-acyl-sn-glycerol-3-phosphate acyltransferase [Planctomycetales bacterium]